MVKGLPQERGQVPVSLPSTTVESSEIAMEEIVVTARVLV